MTDALARALEHHKAGRLNEAEAIYRQVLSTDGAVVEAWNLLGLVLLDLARLDEGREALERAVALAPNDANFANHHGIALLRLGKFAEAAAQFARALAIDPEFSSARINLGDTLVRRGMLEEAHAAYLLGQASRPEDAALSKKVAQVSGAIARSCAAQALERKRAGDFEGALAAYDRALALGPNDGSILHNLAVLQKASGQPRAAEETTKRALACAPDLAEAHNLYGALCKESGRISEAETSFRRAIARAPGLVDAHNNLANVLCDFGRVDEALIEYRAALDSSPDAAQVRSNCLMAMQYVVEDQPTLAAAHHQFEERHARTISPVNRTPISRDPNRRLRIGYVSPDFRAHSVAYFLDAIFRYRDRDQIELFAYSDVTQPDGVTEMFSQAADSWCETARLSDPTLAATIAEDRIDLLIDLAGHTAGNRLLTFARKPAPLALSYLGYPHATGLSAIDARISDRLTDPNGDESILRIDPTFLCYTPIGDTPPIKPRSARGREVRFGSFNSLAKLSTHTLDLWARTLVSIPEARLLLKARGLGDEQAREWIFSAFEARGVARSRLELRPPTESLHEHLDSYHEIDIALDPTPYNGTTTTCEALLMGVPVITRAGTLHAGRVGVSLLSAVGLSELVAHSDEEFTAIAKARAASDETFGDRADLRADLRDRLLASVLCDGPRFTRNLESAYRERWKKYCASA